MFYIYSKKKLPKLIFTINLTYQEVTDYVGWGNIYEGYPHINKDNSIIIERDNQFNYPILDGNNIREMTREEKVQEDIEVQLEPGEVIRDKKIIKIAKPQKNEKYLTWNRENEQWEFDAEREQKDYFDLVDNLKSEVLAYGFEYNGHLQKCRVKDITLMVSTITALNVAKKKTGKDYTITWYFEDNVGLEMSTDNLEDLMFSGTMFIQAVYNAENYFKTKISPKNLTKEEFELKVNEIHKLTTSV